MRTQVAHGRAAIKCGRGKPLPHVLCANLREYCPKTPVLCGLSEFAAEIPQSLLLWAKKSSLITKMLGIFGSFFTAERLTFADNYAIIS